MNFKADELGLWNEGLCSYHGHKWVAPCGLINEAEFALVLADRSAVCC